MHWAYVARAALRWTQQVPTSSSRFCPVPQCALHKAQPSPLQYGIKGQFLWGVGGYLRSAVMVGGFDLGTSPDLRDFGFSTRLRNRP